MSGKFTGCIAYIYDNQGNLLTTTKVLEHFDLENSIEIPVTDSLTRNQKYKILILSSPAPHTCSGTVYPRGKNLVVKMFRGEQKENRQSTRYRLTGTALITACYYKNKIYNLHTPIETELINISTGGIRFCARFNTLRKDDCFNLRIEVGGNTKNLKARVVNLRSIEQISEYGCVLVGDHHE